MMNLKTMNRFQAAGTHLLFSGVVALLSAGLVFLLWYPGLLSDAGNVTNIYLLVLAVDVVLGPLITLTVFNPLKKELRRDLLIVVLVQMAALLYGLHVVFITRPVYLVFNRDLIHVVNANDISAGNLDKVSNPAYRGLPWFGPKTVAVRLPTDTQAQKEILQSMLSGRAGLQQMPQYYLPYAELQNAAAQGAQPLMELQAFNPNNVAAVEALLKKYEVQNREVGFLPVKARLKDLTVVLDKKTGAVLEMVDLQPWK